MSADAEREKPGLVSGRKVLVFSAVFLVAATFVATWLTLRWVEERASHVPPLQWSQRADWNALRVQWKELVPPPGPRPPFESKYRSIELTATPEQLAAVEMLASASDIATPESIRLTLAEHPDLFYGWYLLGLEHQQAGELTEAEAAFEQAMQFAPAAVRLTFEGEDGHPATDLTVPLIEIACARREDGELDDSTRLVYRDVRTDAQGQVYVPVFDVPCVVTDLQPPEGRVLVSQWPGWFTFPGQVGRLPTVQVRER